jgi:hypothetical protein
VEGRVIGGFGAAEEAERGEVAEVEGGFAEGSSRRGSWFAGCIVRGGRRDGLERSRGPYSLVSGLVVERAEPSRRRFEFRLGAKLIAVGRVSERIFGELLA